MTGMMNGSMFQKDLCPNCWNRSFCMNNYEISAFLNNG